MRRTLGLLLCLLPLLVLAGCGGDDDGDPILLSGDTTRSETTTTTSETTRTTSETVTTTVGETTTADASTVGCVEAEMPSLEARNPGGNPPPLDESKTYEVTLDTNCGSFTITLDQVQSPMATASFVALAEQGYFDGTIFHRIVPDFVIQGGDPTGTGTGGPGYSTVDTPPADATYRHGAVAMAKSGAEAAGTAGSQFFVVTTTQAPLSPDYAIIGRVTDGLEVVDAIGELGGLDEQPTQVVVIEKATVASS